MSGDIFLIPESMMYSFEQFDANSMMSVEMTKASKIKCILNNPVESFLIFNMFLQLI